MAHSNEANLPKILMDYEEYERLKHIEEEFMKLKVNSSPSTSGLQRGFGTEDFSQKIANLVYEKVRQNPPITGNIKFNFKKKYKKYTFQIKKNTIYHFYPYFNVLITINKWRNNIFLFVTNIKFSFRNEYQI